MSNETNAEKINESFFEKATALIRKEISTNDTKELFKRFSAFLAEIHQDFPEKFTGVQIGETIKLCNEVLSLKSLLQEEKLIKALLPQVYLTVYQELNDMSGFPSECIDPLTILESNIIVVSARFLNDQVVIIQKSKYNGGLLASSVKCLNIASLSLKEQNFDQSAKLALKAMKKLEPKVISSSFTLEFIMEISRSLLSFMCVFECAKMSSEQFVEDIRAKLRPEEVKGDGQIRQIVEVLVLSYYTHGLAHMLKGSEPEIYQKSFKNALALSRKWLNSRFPQFHMITKLRHFTKAQGDLLREQKFPKAISEAFSSSSGIPESSRPPLPKKIGNFARRGTGVTEKEINYRDGLSLGNSIRRIGSNLTNTVVTETNEEISIDPKRFFLPQIQEVLLRYEALEKKNLELQNQLNKISKQAEEEKLFFHSETSALKEKVNFFESCIKPPGQLQLQYGNLAQNTDSPSYSIRPSVFRDSFSIEAARFSQSETPKTVDFPRPLQGENSQMTFEALERVESAGNGSNSSNLLPPRLIPYTFSFGTSNINVNIDHPDAFDENGHIIRKAKKSHYGCLPKYNIDITRNFSLDLSALEKDGQIPKPKTTKHRPITWNKAILRKLGIDCTDTVPIPDFIDLDESKFSSSKVETSASNHKDGFFDSFYPILANESGSFRVIQETNEKKLFFEFSFEKKKNEMVLNIKILNEEFEAIQSISPVTLDEENLKVALNQVVTDDVCPPFAQFRLATKLKDLVRFYISPFFSLSQRDDVSPRKKRDFFNKDEVLEAPEIKKLEIHMYQQPNGLVPEIHKEFLGKKVKINAYVLSHCLLSISIKKRKAEEDSKAGIRVFLHLHETTFEKHITTTYLSKKVKGKEDLHFLMEVVEGIKDQNNDSTADDHLKKLIYDISHAKEAFSVDFSENHHLFCNLLFSSLESCSSSLSSPGLGSPILPNNEKFVSLGLHIEGVIEMIEKTAKETPGIKAQMKKLMKKAPKEKEDLLVIHFKEMGNFKKGTACFVVDSKKEKEVKVNLVNKHKTHAPKGAKVEAVGSKAMKYSEVEELFCVHYEKMSREEKTIVLSLIAAHFDLLTFSSDLDQYEAMEYSENSITHRVSQVLLSKRVFMRNNSDSLPAPVTISLWGLDFVPSFIKVSFYDCQTKNERGYLVTLDESNWRRPGMSPYKLDFKKRTRFDLEGFFETYFLPEMLRKVGWDLCLDFFCPRPPIRNDGPSGRIQGAFLNQTRNISPVVTKGIPSFVNSLENLFTIQNIQESIQKAN